MTTSVGRWSSKAWDRLRVDRPEATAPLRWLGRGVRAPGPERRHLVQAGKATFAAVAAWILASTVLRLPQPFLAPYAAIFLVQATVYRSVLSWAQQVGAVAGSVVLASMAVAWIPSVPVGLGVVVFVGLVAGGWRGFGDSGPWVGITGMLLITYGGAAHEVLLFDRLLETALGAGIGALVNALVFPPLYSDRAAEVTERLSCALADVLELTAAVVRTDEPADTLERCRARLVEAHSVVVVAQDAADWNRAGRRLNHRRTASGRRHDRPLATLNATCPHVGQLVAAVRTATELQRPFVYPASDARDAFATLLDALTHTVRGLGETAGVAERDLVSCQEAMADVDRHLLAPSDRERPTVGLGGMVLPARQVLQELAAV